MSTTFTCDDKQTLVAYLYGEADAAARDRVEAHLAVCATCAEEVRALGGVRDELGLWVPPEVELGFQIVRKSEAPAPVLRPAQWWRTVPAWAQAAAAVLVLAAGLGIANVRVQSGPESFSVSTGWMAPAAPVAAPAQRTDDEWRTALASLEQQLRTEIRSTREQTPVRAATPVTVDEATIRRVQQLLAASEERQERELALRFTQFVADQTVQRRADMMRITQSLGQFDQQMFRQRQMMNNVIRVANAPQ